MHTCHGGETVAMRDGTVNGVCTFVEWGSLVGGGLLLTSVRMIYAKRLHQIAVI